MGKFSTHFTLLLTLLNAHYVSAEIQSSSADHYILKHESYSDLSPSKLWARLIKPADWWHPDHTYSGDSANLSLDVRAGGIWREDWQGNSIAHGTILLVKEGELLRLNAPFGPLQEMAVNVVWTITLKPSKNGTLVTFKELANGTKVSKLDELAKAVDFVKGEAIKRLTTNNKGKTE